MNGRRGKSARIAGFFFLMVGLGLVLDHGPRWLSDPALLAGSASFGWGLLRMRKAAEPLP